MSLTGDASLEDRNFLINQENAPMSQNILEDDLYLDRVQAAAAIKVCPKTIDKFTAQPDGLKSVRIGRKKYIRRAWLTDFLERRAKQPRRRGR